jgi:murein DD-endopeptidase MepM/ murein hydrolase activator NlpD
MGRLAYEFDKVNFHIRKVSLSISEWIWRILKYFIVSATLALLYYLVFSLFISTDTERKLLRENRMYARIYPEMQSREQLIEDVIDGLAVKDERIYHEIFNASPPSLQPLATADYLEAVDSIPDREIVDYTSRKAEGLQSRAASTEANFRKLFALLSSSDAAVPPLSLPLKELSYAQVGASCGEKLNPFYKVPVQHNGIDLLSPQGSDVLAAADGTVTEVIHSRKGMGNVVEITHQGGYVTRYAHLSDIVVRKGAVVRRGAKIADVGISGNSFAPHLHYEVLRGGVPLDPVNFFFASVTPEEYADFLYMASATGQSMD